MGYNLTPPEFIEMLRKDKKKNFRSPQKLLDSVKNILEIRINKQILNFFHSKPMAKLEIVEVPPKVLQIPLLPII